MKKLDPLLMLQRGKLFKCRLYVDSERNAGEEETPLSTRLG